MKEFPEFFVHLKMAFPMGVLLGMPSPYEKPVPLVVHEVGDFEASFVPGLGDFERLDPRFRIPRTVWDGLPAHQDSGFAVFKLKASTRKVHPMAFEFPRRQPELLISQRFMCTTAPCIPRPISTTCCIVSLSLAGTTRCISATGAGVSTKRIATSICPRHRGWSTPWSICSAWSSPGVGRTRTLGSRSTQPTPSRFPLDRPLLVRYGRCPLRKDIKRSIEYWVLSAVRAGCA